MVSWYGRSAQKDRMFIELCNMQGACYKNSSSIRRHPYIVQEKS